MVGIKVPCDFYAANLVGFKGPYCMHGTTQQNGMPRKLREEVAKQLCCRDPCQCRLYFMFGENRISEPGTPFAQLLEQEDREIEAIAHQKGEGLPNRTF